MDIATGQHLGQSPADQFSDAELALRWSGTVMKFVLAHDC